MDQTTLERLLYPPCRAMCERFRQAHGPNLIGFGLYTSEDFSYLGIIGATLDGKRRHDAVPEPDLSALPAGIGKNLKTSPLDADRFHYVTEEWDLTPQEDGCEAVNALLRSWYDAIEDHEGGYQAGMDTHCTLVRSAALAVLGRLVRDGALGTGSERERILVMLGMADSTTPFEAGVAWSEQLNTPAMHRKYAAFAAVVRDRGWY